MSTIDQQLSSCDKEPIHIIGGIQSHGVLLAVNPVDQRIVHASENSHQYLNLSARLLLGRRLSEFLEAESAAKLTEKLRDPAFGGGETLLALNVAEMGACDALMYESGGLAVIELEPARPHPEQVADEFVAGLQSSNNLESAAKMLARSVRALTGFERVMIYKFLDNWDGLVVAEDRIPAAHSFLNHRFPAGDIPVQARALYQKNRTRLIPDVDSPVAALVPGKDKNGAPLDLSRSKLRAVSPVHLEYLRNMNVRASFSVAILNGDKLWGLVACHSSEVVYLSQAARKMCESIANMFGIAAAMMERLSDQDSRLKFEQGLRSVFQELKIKTGPLDHLFRMHAKVCELFRADGMAFVSGGKIDIAGFTPSRDQVASAARHLTTLMHEHKTDIYATEALSKLGMDIPAEACGVLALALPEVNEATFLLFRREFEQTVTWGGDPRKLMDQRGYQGTINPRKSFEGWSETIRNRSARWEPYEIQGGRYLRDFVFDALVKKELLIEELGRRTH